MSIQQAEARFQAALGRNTGSVLTPELALGLFHLFATEMQRLAVQPLNLGSYPDAVVHETGTIFRSMPLQDALDMGLRGLHRDHWQETERWRESIAFRPDYDRLLAYESLGRFVQLVAICNARVVGGFGFYLERSMHTQLLVGREDSLFVEKDYRGHIAMAFMLYVTEFVRAIGVSELTVTTKVLEGRDRVGTLLRRRLGFKHVANEYSLLGAVDA